MEISGGTSAYFSGYWTPRVPPNFCTGSSTGSTGPPEVPVATAVLPLLLPVEISGGTSAYVFRFWMFWSLPVLAGSSPGTTGRPELPVLLPVLPALRVLSLAVDRLFLGGPEVPPFGPVLPVLRVFFPGESRWGLFFTGR